MIRLRTFLWTVFRGGAVTILLALMPSWASPNSADIATLLKTDNFADDGLTRFYQSRQFQPAWTGSGAAEANARLALSAMAHADQQGMNASRYRVQAGDGAARDLAISAAVLRYMQELHGGRTDLKRLDADVALPPDKFDAAGELEASLRQGGFAALLAALAPSDPQYGALKAALARYRKVVADGGWPIVPNRALLEGDAKTAELLRQRLAFEGILPSEDGGGGNLTKEIRLFQFRHGLAADGVLGQATLTVLNRPPTVWIDVIAANLERRRWLPRPLESDRIVINAAEAKLEMVLDGKPALSSRVIVGRPMSPTPILRADGAGITINPPWTVPASIAVAEILPKLKRNSSYLATQDMFLLDGPSGDPQGLHVNWRAIPRGTFPYRIRQVPGPNNPLGRVKLELPNRFDVYLHDTPAKAGFARDARDVSHGCVRVEQILPLASYALTADLSAMNKIVQDIDTGETKYLPLQKKLPVYFLYWTAFADADGAIEFRPDIYGRDHRLIAGLIAATQGLSSGSLGCSRS